ncbi:MAG TPA: hypothetical protein PLZ84_03535 [Clostridia bacterium]|nr:hypothetical protein [Clostridia bacterium]
MKSVHKYNIAAGNENNGSADDVYVSATLKVGLGTDTVEAYKFFNFSRTWHESGDGTFGWLAADGFPAHFIREHTDEIPELVYNGYISVLHMFLHKEDYIPLYGTIYKYAFYSAQDWSVIETGSAINSTELNEKIAKLAKGEYYISFDISYNGRYIKEEADYETWAYRYYFKLIKD